MTYLVKHYMRKTIPTIASNKTVLETVHEMLGHGTGFVLVLKNGQFSGIVTEHDVMDKIVAGGKNPIEINAEDIMSSPIITVGPEDDLAEASKLMIEHNIRRLAVVRDGIMYGVLSARDIAKALESYVDGATRDILRLSSSLFSR